MSAGTAWIAVRQVLKPLRATAKEAAQIDMNSLEQRLATDDVPIEITPLVDAVNEAIEPACRWASDNATSPPIRAVHVRPDSLDARLRPGSGS